MGEKALYQSHVQLFTAIENCIEKKLQLPALMLIYSGLDIAGWLASSTPCSVRSRFTRWIDSYLLPAKPLPCTSLELYAARCGLLHTFTSDSDLSDAGQARRIVYSWGTASADDLQKVLVQTNQHEFVALHVNDLFEGYRLGMAEFIEETINDAVAAERLEQNARGFFTSLSNDAIQDFL